MATHLTDGDTRLSLWRRVREYAVPLAMIETATARRTAGDWAGACAAAGFDVDLDLRELARARGRDVRERLRADLRRLAPDLLRWHLPRVAPDGLLRPGLTMPLARYDTGEGPLCLVVRTPPAWADAGQRIGLALWDGTPGGPAARGHPHPHPSRRFRFDLHRHLWDAGAAGELRTRSGADLAAGGERCTFSSRLPLLERSLCAVDRWADEARIVLGAAGRDRGAVVVRLGGRQRFAVHLAADGTATAGPDTDARAPGSGARPVLPDAATWVLPDLELLRAGLVDAGRLHPLVAEALVPGHPPAPRDPYAGPARQPGLVECRGARHRIGLVDGVLSPLDHSSDELRREELLVALGGPPLPCLRVIDEAHRRPDCLTGVRERLDHGDLAGALAVVEGLLGPEAVLRDGPLKDELEAAAQRRIAYGLYRAGLAGSRGGPVRARRLRSVHDPRLGPRPANRR
ncbi:hypothetical protein [Streptomyces sp. Ag109_O5-10]|uniref:hypothetical protein n=1 Tax=Streptomyces sp. Ag109_O5-10 TaxID=1855349 RepID=UPI00089BFDB3|nr:hypothetical protein [Streptomyces sp. Ag109_O5-10]SED87327.1 hypothetical protein SAMN05216533_0793 [Streptomyces sp. Ag109_O5-10]